MITSQGKRIKAVVAVSAGIVTVLLVEVKTLSAPKSKTATDLSLLVVL
jgi:uncharacterized protein with PQ loop repeat